MLHASLTTSGYVFSMSSTGLRRSFRSISITSKRYYRRPDNIFYLRPTTRLCLSTFLVITLIISSSISGRSKYCLYTHFLVSTKKTMIAMRFYTFVAAILVSSVPNVSAFTASNQNKFIGRPVLSQSIR